MRIKDQNEIFLIHAETLRLEQVSCRELLSRGNDLVNHLGYRSDGIVKGSHAARVMSAESKLHDGKLPSVKYGGVSAALQSIGATGEIKDRPRENIECMLRNMGLLCAEEHAITGDANNQMIIIKLPSYFIFSFDNEPTLVDDYRIGGYNYFKAEEMLNQSILPFCRMNDTPCCLDESSRFTVTKFQRLENIKCLEKHLRYEARVAMDAIKQHQNTRMVSPDLPDWLKKLSRKNGLNPRANTVYLLHGTTRDRLGDIVREGLKTKFSLERSFFQYGKGLYFADKACKASQYTDNDDNSGVFLVCRVVLGRIQILSGQCKEKLFPSSGYDSCHAQANVTASRNGYKQLHNEFIIYDDSACYPEFVIHFDRY